MTYDATGKPATVVAGSSTQTLVHDASGSLLLESDPVSGSTLYLGATELHVAAGSSTVTAVRTYTANGTPIAERTTAAGVTGSVVTWLGADAQNTVGVEVNSATGTVTRRYADPFGNARGPAVTWSDAHGYLNAPVSPFSGLTTLGARQYDATLGRFLSVDAVLAPFNPQQNDGYSYSRNNPVTMADPSGNCANAGVLTVSACAANDANPWLKPVASFSHNPPAAPGKSAGKATSSTKSKPGWYKTYLKMQKNDAVGCGADYNPCASDQYLFYRAANKATPGQKLAAQIGAVLAVGLLLGLVCYAICVGVFTAASAEAGGDAVVPDAVGDSVPEGETAAEAESGPSMKIDDAQFGSKVGKHASDFGKDPSDLSTREWLKDYINEIRNSPDEIRQGDYNPKAGGGSDYWFYRKGPDVVLTKNDGQFVTILKDGVTNGWFGNAVAK